MLAEIENYRKRKKREKILRKVKRYGAIALIILIPVAVAIILNHLKRKAKKKVKEAIKEKVSEHRDKQSVSED